MSNALFINSKYDEYDIIDDNETIQDHPSNLEIIKLF